ncbi:MAG: hypothetical protein AAGC65_15810 [Mucilaginibacter sp.]|uniref:hypothetical protein n=1 Tax=Mucilaginibacter sp. TaxID=1882438 RepID=UPI0031AB5A23
MNDYLNPDQNRESNQQGYKNMYTGTGQNERYIEKYGPHRGHFKVLHEDGSLADLPDQHVEGGGALAGCITK